MFGFVDRFPKILLAVSGKGDIMKEGAGSAARLAS
jgi:hypothetical protein